MPRRHVFLATVGPLLLCVSAAAPVRAAPPTAAAKPNVLFLYTDDQAFDTIRALGNREIRTPNLDRLARAGVAFDNCYNQGGWHGAVCVASRTMLNTGRFLWQAYAAEKRFSANPGERPPFWSELMRRAGYRTYMTGKWHIRGVNPAEVFDETGPVRPGMPGTCEEAYERPRAGKPDVWQAWDPARGGFWQGGTHWSVVTADDAIRFLRTPRPDNRPFFLYAAFNAPHDPRQSPKPYVDLYPPDSLALPPSFLPSNPHKDAIGCPHTLRDERLAPDPRTPHAVRVHRAEYYAIITHLDAQIGRVLDALEATGLTTNTFVFLTGDNGLALGQHGFMGKQNMFEHSMKVPLLVAGPGVPRNRRIRTPVYLQDIMPTTLELAGCPVPPQVRFRSLLPLLAGQRETQYEAVYGAYMRLQRMVRSGDMKLIWYPACDTFLLFNLADDPHELNNLAAEPAHAATLARLKRLLASMQQEMEDPLLPDSPQGIGEPHRTAEF
ncbi:MAG: sulfatase-like hydrolase/transferase [Kiritimatiellia bacterium]|nr:sulfatase-like hydrolase/transferase [Kiritimatiellia bacterium]